MPSYKLSYFKKQGRGELARLMFAAAGKEFEDERLEGETWLSFKPSQYKYFIIKKINKISFNVFKKLAFIMLYIKIR